VADVRRQRVVIEAVRPVVNAGEFAAKAVVGQPLEVRATVFADGHDQLISLVRHGRPGRDGRLAAGASEVALHELGNDAWSGHLTPRRLGPHAFEVVSLVDVYGSWLRDLRIRHQAGQALAVEFEEGASIVERQAALDGLAGPDRRALAALAAALRSPATDAAPLRAAGRAPAVALMRRTADRSAATVSLTYPVWVDRELAGFSAWYEFFPRSEGAHGHRSGTFAHAARRLPAIAEMGFDIVYLPPVHPIGSSHRKGRNNALEALPGEPGSPWAIGSDAGGHTAVHPDLGTLADFDAFVAEARRQGLEVALDYALQCSPDHPWVREHPAWFRHRPDGSIRYAENPPKRYQDIYPINFDTDDAERLWAALRDVLLFWIGHGVRVFRVDNPHTKSLRFWDWVIEQVHRRFPDVLFLAEAFTRPAVMHRLAKGGFTQSYTYFTWRNSKQELTDYLTELSQGEGVDYFRPNFWPNTPDILHESLQQGGPAAFRLRLVLAALGAPSWGMYSGYELLEHQAVRPGSEEYLDSEKYQYRPRNWDVPGSLVPLVTLVNAIRRRHREAIALLRTLRVHPVDGEALLCFSRSDQERSDVLLVIANLDVLQAREGMTWLDLATLGLEPNARFEAHDELTDTTYIWQGPANYVRLDPAVSPAHVLRVRPR